MLVVLPFFLFFFFCNTLPITTLHLIQFFSFGRKPLFFVKGSLLLTRDNGRIQSTENIVMRRHYYIHIVKCVARWICGFIPLSQKCSIMNTAILFTNIPGKQVHISSADFNLILLQISMYASIACSHWILEACSSCFCSIVSLVCKTMGGERKTLKKKIKVKKMQFDFSDPLAIFIPS